MFFVAQLNTKIKVLFFYWNKFISKPFALSILYSDNLQNHVINMNNWTSICVNNYISVNLNKQKYMNKWRSRNKLHILHWYTLVIAPCYWILKPFAKLHLILSVNSGQVFDEIGSERSNLFNWYKTLSFFPSYLTLKYSL